MTLDPDMYSETFRRFYEAFNPDTCGGSVGRAAEEAILDYDRLSQEEKAAITECLLELFNQRRQYYGIPYLQLAEKMNDPRFLPSLRDYYATLSERHGVSTTSYIDGRSFTAPADFSAELKQCKRIITLLSLTEKEIATDKEARKKRKKFVLILCGIACSLHIGILLYVWIDLLCRHRYLVVEKPIALLACLLLTIVLPGLLLGCGLLATKCRKHTRYATLLSLVVSAQVLLLIPSLFYCGLSYLGVGSYTENVAHYGLYGNYVIEQESKFPAHSDFLPDRSLVPEDAQYRYYANLSSHYEISLEITFDNPTVYQAEFDRLKQWNMEHFTSNTQATDGAPVHGTSSNSHYLLEEVHSSGMIYWPGPSHCIAYKLSPETHNIQYVIIHGYFSEETILDQLNKYM